MTSQHEQMNKLDDPGQVALTDDASFIEGNGEMVRLIRSGNSVR
jgi:hypothetical protein